MATVQEAIRRLKVESTSSGVTETTDKLRGLAKAHGDVAIASERSQRATQSADKRLESIQRRYDQAYNAQVQLAKVERDLNTARGQGLITQARQNELMALASAQHSRTSRGMQELQAQAQGAASRLGTMGTVLAGLGPIGLAVAVALGAAAVATKHMVDEANRLSDKAGKLVDFAETTGLSTTALQALHKAAAEVGLDADKVGTALERFTVQFNDLRRGSGELYKALNRIDPALTSQLAATADAAQAWDLYAAAVGRARDQQERNALVAAALGRRNIGAGRLLTATDQAGGIDGLTRGLERANVLTAEQLRRWDDLKDRIDFTAATARDQFASIFTDDVLKGQLRFYDGLLSIAQVAKSIPWRAMLLPWTASLAGRGVASTGAAPAAGAASGPALPSFSLSGVSRATGLNADASIPSEFQLARLKAIAEAMGSAATAAQQLEIKQRALAISAKEAGLSQEQYNRALGALNLETIFSLESRRLGLLGDLANAQDVELQKQREINLARMQGVAITKEEEAALRARARIAFENSQLPNQLAFERAQLGRGEIDATVAARLRGANLPIDLNSTTAELIRVNEQLRITRDLSIDFAQGFARDFRTELMNGVNAWDAFAKAGLNALGRLSDKLLDMAIQNLVAKAFGGSGGFNLFSLFGGGGGGVTGAEWAAAGQGLGPLAAMHSGGIVGQVPATRYVHPAYFDDAPRFHLGIDEVPAILQRGERVIPRGQSGGSSPSVTIIQNNTFNGADPGSEARLRAALEITKNQAIAGAVQAVAKTRSDNPDYLRR